MIHEILIERSTIILISNLVLSAFLTGLIWVIQVVHYPLFLRIEPDEFRAYEQSHQKRISMIVAPVMIVDIILSLLLVFTNYMENAQAYIIVAFALNLAVFASTLFIFSPIHQKLGNQYDNALIKKLISLNLMRTAMWTARTILLMVLTIEIFN